MSSVPATFNLDGHLPLQDRLSPCWQYRDLPALSRSFTAYAQTDLWDSDTAQLPAALASIRRRARAFADTQIAPLAARMDLAEHLAPGRAHPEALALLQRAGAKAG